MKTSNGTAVVGDYNPVDTVVTFLPGTSLRTVEIGIIDDNRVEEAELFSVRLSSSDSNVIVGPQNQSHVIILDNDGNAYNHFVFKDALHFKLTELIWCLLSVM